MPFSSRRGGGVFRVVVGVLPVLVACAAPISRSDQPGARTTGPWDLAALRRAPWVKGDDVGKGVTAVYYQGEPYQGKPTRVFGWLARPERAELPQLRPLMYFLTATDERKATVSTEHEVVER